MQLPNLLLPLALSLAAAPPTTAKKPPPPPAKDAILLSRVEALTLRAGQRTTHRRVAAIPQLRCASARRELCALHEVAAMRCTNQGGGYGGPELDAQWSCVADLPPELRLAAADVVCEGYAGPHDPYVLRGSCGVVYSLALTELGEARFPELVGGGGGWWGADGTRQDGSHATDWSAVLFSVVFLAVCVWILVSACRNAAANNNTGDRRRRPPPRRGAGFGGGGWGGGDDGWDDPPPPYPGSKPSYSSSASSQGWRPGFWSGLAGGAAAGYAAGNAGRANRNRNDYRGGGGSGGSSGWGGFGGSSSSRSGSATVSTSRHESIGFGSTSRR